MSSKLTDEQFDNLNKKAYLEVLGCENSDPLFKDNETYMNCYHYWRNLAGESHFDLHFNDNDFLE